MRRWQEGQQHRTPFCIVDVCFINVSPVASDDSKQVIRGLSTCWEELLGRFPFELIPPRKCWWEPPAVSQVRRPVKKGCTKGIDGHSTFILSVVHDVSFAALRCPSHLCHFHCLRSQVIVFRLVSQTHRVTSRKADGTTDLLTNPTGKPFHVVVEY